MTDPRERWLLRPVRRLSPRLRLFCFPYAGGGASLFHAWATRVPPWMEVCGVQLPGRENRVAEAPYRDPLLLGRDLVMALLPYFDRPFAVFGHSLGARLGFELLAQLGAEGRPSAERLFVSAARPPHLRGRRPPMRDASDERLIEEVSRLGGTALDVLRSPELMALALPLLRADFSLHEAYQSDVVLETPITAFCGDVDPEVSSGEMSAWEFHTRADFRLRIIDGDHFFLRGKIDALIAQVLEDLEG